MPWLDTNLQNPALRPLAERLVSELRLGDDHTDAVEMLLANLQQAGQEPLLFRRAADAYSPNRYQRFDRHHILSPLWRMRGRHIGESKASAGHAPTAQALPLLQSRLSRIEATAVFAEPIILRSEKLWSEKRAARVAAGIDYEDTDETNRMREGLRRYNDVMAQHRVVDVTGCGLSRYSTGFASRSIVTRPARSVALRDRLGPRVRCHNAGRRGVARKREHPGVSAFWGRATRLPAWRPVRARW